MGLFKLIAAKRAKTQIENCVKMFHIYTTVHLMKKYKDEYDGVTNLKIATAVANELFGFQPSNQSERDFLADKLNMSLVDSELRKIAADSKICRVVSVCAYVRSNAAAYGAMAIHPKLQWAVKTGLTPELLQWVVKMKELGILLPDEKIDSDWPSSMDDFRRKAMEFKNWVLTPSS